MTNLTKSKNNGIFLFLIILFTVIFVAVVCTIINDRNNKIITGATIGETDNIEAQTEQQSDENENNTRLFQGLFKNNEEPTTTITYETEKNVYVVITPGTIDNPTIISVTDETFHLTYLNEFYRIKDNYVPDLVYVAGSSERLDSRVATFYNAMYDAAKKDGVYLTPCSGYRSIERQELNYNNKVSYYENLGYTKEEAKIKAASIIRPPGSSEHNIGLAMDIVCVDEWFEDTDEFKWLMENAADYGFILRYPKDKQDITGVTYEPWHWRFVGIDVAKEMKANGQVLEEYLGVK